MVDDIDDLLVEQARVDRVAHRADAGDAVIQLEMAEIVPRQRADPVAGSDPEPQQRLRQTPRAALGLGVGVAVDRAIDEAGDHFDIAVVARRVPDQRRDQQLPLRHQPAHALLPRAEPTPHTDLPDYRPGRPGRSRQSRRCGQRRRGASSRRDRAPTGPPTAQGDPRCRTSIMCRWTFRTRSTPS